MKTGAMLIYGRQRQCLVGLSLPNPNPFCQITPVALVSAAKDVPARDRLSLVGKPFTVRTDKARKELGYSPRVTWKAGIAEMTAN